MKTDKPIVYPQRLVGMKMRTTLVRFVDEEEALLISFLGKVARLQEENLSFYTVTKKVNDDEFDFWYTAETKPETPIPTGLEFIDTAHGTLCSMSELSMEDTNANFALIIVPWACAHLAFSCDGRVMCVNFREATEDEVILEHPPG